MANDAALPTVTTAKVTSIGETCADSGGNVTSDGGDPVTARGVSWSTSADPTTSDSRITNGAAFGTFINRLTGLSPGTTYHVRAYATNEEGTAYGIDVTFTTTVFCGDVNENDRVDISDAVFTSPSIW